MKVHFYVNGDKPDAVAGHETIASAAARFGLEETPAASADVVIALGGDGTILRAVHDFPGKPILGLNLGGLGYLSSVEEKDAESALARLSRGEYAVVERTMLRVGDHTALNDVVVMREMSGHAALLDLEVAGSAATRYMADGLIVATPTGSTAYSLSAGGPVLMPDSRSFVITPMSPHALGIRPMVVGEDGVITITARTRTQGRFEQVGVYADGENVMKLDPDGQVEIYKSERGALLVQLDGSDPYAVLARKLGWSGTSVK